VLVVFHDMLQFPAPTSWCSSTSSLRGGGDGERQAPVRGLLPQGGCGWRPPLQAQASAAPLGWFGGSSTRWKWLPDVARRFLPTTRKGWPWCGGGVVTISRGCGPVEARAVCVWWLSRSSERKLARLWPAGGGGACGRHSPPLRRLRGVFFDLSCLGASYLGESLDPLGWATSFLLWGATLMILLPSVLLGGLDAHDIAVDGRRCDVSAWWLARRRQC
jgi:hypothetical protein